jgi:HAD superfamily hydrolase (TIGR01509 family)
VSPVAERLAALLAAARAGAVVFDMDGVLIDSEPLGLVAMRQVLARFGCGYTEADNEQFVGRTTEEAFAVLCARHGLPERPEALAREFTRLKVRALEADPQPMPGVPEICHRLAAAGFRLALASSAAPEEIAAAVGALGLGARFETAVSAADVARGKPAPDLFLEAARRLGVAPARCLVIEDSHNGLRAARAAGMACIVVPNAFTRHQDLAAADLCLGSLAELAAVL